MASQSLESTEDLKSGSESGRRLSWEQRPGRELLRLAWPITVSTLSYSVMTLVDTLMVGRLGAAELAGVGLGGTLAFVLLCFSFGLLRGAKTLVAQARGAGREDQVGAYLGAALVWALAIGAVTVLVGVAASPLLARIPADAAAGQAAATYLAIRIVGAPLALAYVALRETRYGTGDARSPMVATIAANVVNMALGWVFIFELGWGVAGAAWATVVAHGVEAGVLLFVQWREGLGVRAMRGRHLAAVWRIGVPTGLQFSLEVGSFGLLAALISRMGTEQMAGHQIALQVIHFSFLPGLGLSEGASVLVGQAVGAGRLDLVRRVARSALAVTSLYTGLCTLVMVVGAPAIAAAFNDAAGVQTVATRLLWIAAIFQVLDGANVIARGVLRGAGDVRVPAAIGVATSWLATPPLTWFLGLYLGLGAAGGWLGLTVEIFACTWLLWRRLERETWRPAALAARAEMVAAASDLGAEAAAVPLAYAEAESAHAAPLPTSTDDRIPTASPAA